MLKADLKKIRYTSPLLEEPRKEIKINQSQETFVGERNFKKLFRTNLKYERSAVTESKDKKNCNENNLSINHSKVMKEVINTSLILPSINNERKQNLSMGKRVYKEAKIQENHISIDFSINESNKTRNDSKKIIEYKASEEYKRYNEKSVCSWDRDFKLRMTDSSKRPESTANSGSITRHKLGFHMKGIKYERCKQTGEMKLLLETSILNEAPNSPSQVSTNLRCISTSNKSRGVNILTKKALKSS